MHEVWMLEKGVQTDLPTPPDLSPLLEPGSSIIRMSTLKRTSSYLLKLPDGTAFHEFQISLFFSCSYLQGQGLKEFLKAEVPKLVSKEPLCVDQGAHVTFNFAESILILNNIMSHTFFDSLTDYFLINSIDVTAITITRNGTNYYFLPKPNDFNFLPHVLIGSPDLRMAYSTIAPLIPKNPFIDNERLVFTYNGASCVVRLSEERSDSSVSLESECNIKIETTNDMDVEDEDNDEDNDNEVEDNDNYADADERHGKCY